MDFQGYVVMLRDVGNYRKLGLVRNLGLLTIGSFLQWCPLAVGSRCLAGWRPDGHLVSPEVTGSNKYQRVIPQSFVCVGGFVYERKLVCR